MAEPTSFVEVKPGQRIQKPWGSEVLIEVNDRYVVKELHVNPGARLSLQYHHTKVEHMTLVAGRATLQLEQSDEWDNYVLTDLHMLYFTPIVVHPPLLHRLVAGPNGCLVVEVSSPHLDDICRVQDDHGREVEPRYELGGEG